MLYVHLCSCLMPHHQSLKSISFIICCRKNQSSTQTWGIQHAMRVLSLSEKYAGSKPKDLWPWPFVASSPFWDSLPQCTAQVRHGCLERLKSAQLEITPFMATACQIHKHAKHRKTYSLFKGHGNDTEEDLTLLFFWLLAFYPVKLSMISLPTFTEHVPLVGHYTI